MELMEVIVSTAGDLYYMLLSAVGTGSYPRKLTAKEERACIEAACAGDKSARAKLIEHNLRLVAHIIKKFYLSASDMEDMLSIGTIGLIKAVDSYRTDKKVRFSSYASRCIENECLMYLRSQKKSSQDVSINEPIETDKNGNEISLIDVIASQDMFEDQLGDRLGMEQLERLLDGLEDSRELEIIRLRYGLNGDPPLTQKEAAQKLGISRSYVSRIEKKMIERLREMME